VAADFLGQALALAAPEGFRRMFVDEGPGLAELLRQARHVTPAFVDELLSLAPASAATSVSDAAAPSLLSAQELNVLALLAAGKSNAEIAAALFISPGTAKWHVHNILQKLEAGNRAQAIARAREMGLA
jgi:LuxR family maltose regulon positive regulatory protein